MSVRCRNGYQAGRLSELDEPTIARAVPMKFALVQHLGL
jgi:hypothetical protein